MQYLRTKIPSFFHWLSRFLSVGGYTADAAASLTADAVYKFFVGGEQSLKHQRISQPVNSPPQRTETAVTVIVSTKKGAPDGGAFFTVYSVVSYFTNAAKSEFAAYLANSRSIAAS